MDNRRFPRIYLQSQQRQLTTLLGARATWSNGERLDINDLSYTGAALIRTARLQCEMNEKVQVHFQLAGQKEFIVFSEVIRITEKICAIQFGPLTTDARVALERYLHEKMIGLHVRNVDPKYFARPGSATHWFHGPNNTNFFLWYEAGHLEKAIVELGSDFLHWENGQFSEGNTAPYLDNAGDDYVKPLLAVKGQPTTKDKLTPLMARIVDIISQIDDPEHVMEPMTQAILARQK